jgi:hypothetical protein
MMLKTFKIGFCHLSLTGLHGASVFISGRRKDALESACQMLQAEGISATGLQGDVRDQDACNRSVWLAHSKFCSYLILVLDGFRKWLSSSPGLIFLSTVLLVTFWPLLRISHKMASEQVGRKEKIASEGLSEFES